MNRSSVPFILIDWLAAVVAWITFFCYRKMLELSSFAWEDIVSERQLLLGLLVIPSVWVFFWMGLGLYHNVYRKSRIQVLYLTLLGSIVGALGLLFTVIRDDLTLTITSYLTSFLAVLLIHWLIFSIFRLIYLSATKILLAHGKFRFKGLIISDQPAQSEINLPFTLINDHLSTDAFDLLSKVSSFDTLVVQSDNQEKLKKIIPLAIGLAGRKEVVVDQSTFELLDYDYKGQPRLRHNYISLRTSPILTWQKTLKRSIDIAVSIVMLVLLSPLMIWLYVRVKSSSEGAVIFRQERLGLNGGVFNILKFRSMYQGAESDGPQLANENDDRCTPFGKWMRRWRLDELPQFFNVIQGNMSLVGPRPERPFYSKQLVDANPRFALLWQVKPGITSWGQIKFGYASNLTEMLTRFRYDLLYIEHMSIILDIRILYYTLLVLWQGRGR